MGIAKGADWEGWLALVLFRDGLTGARTRVVSLGRCAVVEE
jgi:hypothetical protein